LIFPKQGCAGKRFLIVFGLGFTWDRRDEGGITTVILRIYLYLYGYNISVIFIYICVCISVGAPLHQIATGTLSLSIYIELAFSRCVYI